MIEEEEHNYFHEIRSSNLNNLTFNQKIAIAALVIPIFLGMVSFYFSINNQFVKMNIDIINMSKNLSVMEIKINELEKKITLMNLTIVKQCEQIENIRDKITQIHKKD